MPEFFFHLCKASASYQNNDLSVPRSSALRIIRNPFFVVHEKSCFLNVSGRTWSYEIFVVYFPEWAHTEPIYSPSEPFPAEVQAHSHALVGNSHSQYEFLLNSSRIFIQQLYSSFCFETVFIVRVQIQSLSIWCYNVIIIHNVLPVIIIIIIQNSI